jgi:phage baseplate assembly protein gpV
MKVIADLLSRITHLEQRLGNMAVHGPVHEVDAAKQVARLRLGGTDAEPYLSPWVPYSQLAGAFKGHVPVTAGQNMTLFAPSGVPEQGMLLPFTFNNAHPSPSQKADENVFTFGSMKAEIRGEEVVLTVGASVITITSGKITIKSGEVETTSGKIAYKKG